MAKKIGIGIDFGTTNSLVSVDRGEKEVFSLLEGGRPHPSAVWSGPKLQVCNEAKKKISESNAVGAAGVRSIKRYLSDGSRPLLPLHPDADANGRVDPTRIASEVFKHLAEHFKANMPRETLDQAVVTIPVGFGSEARKNIAAAAGLAGIEVLQFVHEPLAALVGWFRDPVGPGLSPIPDGDYVVIDWGGGTLDICVVRATRNKLIQLGIADLRDQAGDTFDGLLADLAQERFAADHGISVDVLTSNTVARARLIEQCEQAKITLSLESSASVAVAGYFQVEGKPKELIQEITRDDFESLIESTVVRGFGEVNNAMNRAGIAPTDVRSVLLVGGTANIPRIQREAASLFGDEKVRAMKDLKGQTLIAEGAATIAEFGAGSYLAESISVDTVAGPHIVFPAGSDLPTQGQRSVVLAVTDPRPGFAYLRLFQDKRSVQARAAQQVVELQVPIRKDVPKTRGPLEEISMKAVITREFVLELEATGSFEGKKVLGEGHELLFGVDLGRRKKDV
jgi:molecular chaperone DnaK (HSP70)